MKTLEGLVKMQQMKEAERREEALQLAGGYKDYLEENYTNRELRLMLNCLTYEESDPAGLPGHNLMILVAKVARDSGWFKQVIEYALGMIDDDEYLDWCFDG